MVSPFSFFVIILVISVQSKDQSGIKLNPEYTNYDEFIVPGEKDEIEDDRINKLEDDDAIAICHQDKIKSKPETLPCPSSSLSSSLALSLLRLSSSPSESFVLSPFSLGSALSLIHDGASGTTQKELTDLLLPGCTPQDVTNYFSSLTLSLPATGTNVSFHIANVVFVNNTISLNDDYAENVASKYTAKVEKVNFEEKKAAAEKINNFVKKETNGKIHEVVEATQISDKSAAIIINGITFHGLWKTEFSPNWSKNQRFHGISGNRELRFMNLNRRNFLVNQDNEFGTALLMPYKDEAFKFFALLPEETMGFENMRNNLTGEKLIEILSKARETLTTISVPKFKIESKLDGSKVLSKLGMTSLFSNRADFSKMSDSPLKFGEISHSAAIEVNESGTEASATTIVAVYHRLSLLPRPPTVHIVLDHPFLYGIVRNDDIIFLGQFV